MYAIAIPSVTTADARTYIDALAGVPSAVKPARHHGHLCFGFDYAGAAALAIRLLMRADCSSFALGIEEGNAVTLPETEACHRVPCTLGAEKEISRRSPIAVACPAHPKRAIDVADALQLISVVLARRTAKQWSIVNLLERGLNGQEAAEELGITKQAVSRHRAASNIDAEHAGWELLVRLLERCEQG